MFKSVRNWIFWYKRTRSWKRFIANELLIARMRGPQVPPTKEQLEGFKKEWNLGWDSHMVQRVEPRKTYFEASLN